MMRAESRSTQVAAALRLSSSSPSTSWFCQRGTAAMPRLLLMLLLMAVSATTGVVGGAPASSYAAEGQTVSGANSESSQVMAATNDDDEQTDEHGLPRDSDLVQYSLGEEDADATRQLRKEAEGSTFFEEKVPGRHHFARHFEQHRERVANGSLAAEGEEEMGRFRGEDGLLGLDYLNQTDESGDGRSRGRRSMLDLFKVVFCQGAPNPPLLRGNLFSNPTFTSSAGWFGFNNAAFSIRRVGRISYGVASGRKTEYSGPAQVLHNLSPAQYELVVWLRLNKGPRQYVQAMAQINGKYTCLGGAIARSNCWTKLMGGFTLENGLKELTIYLQGPTVGTEIWVTSTTLLRLNPRWWRAKQEARINSLRKRDVTLRVVNSAGQQVAANVKIDQTISDYPFGAAVNAAILKDPKYQRWFLPRFNWAVFNNEAKWYFNEGQKGKVDYSITEQMTNWFLSHKVKVRGHNLFWNVRNFVQDWVKELNNEDLWKHMQLRLNGAVKKFVSKFSHWDILNEPLHDDYFDERLGPQVLPWMFSAAKALDSKPQLFINDYNTVEECDGVSHPSYYLAKIWGMTMKGAPVTGIGVEAHFSGRPQPVRIKYDLDQLAVANIPIWITELDFKEKDDKLRADFLEAVMREAFSHPLVDGIMLWMPARSSCKYYQDMDKSLCEPCENCLADSNFVDNESGKRYVRLRKEWSTHIWTTLADGQLRFRGFHGTYRAIVTVDGKKVVRSFRVPKGQSSMVVTLKV